MSGTNTPCPTCGAPCKTTVHMRGGEHGWGTTDLERTSYEFAGAQPVEIPADLALFKAVLDTVPVEDIKGLAVSMFIQKQAVASLTKKLGDAGKLVELEMEVARLRGAMQSVKSNLMHQRRFGVDTLGPWRRACSSAEGDIEEALKQ